MAGFEGTVQSGSTSRYRDERGPFITSQAQLQQAGFEGTKIHYFWLEQVVCNHAPTQMSWAEDLFNDVLLIEL